MIGMIRRLALSFLATAAIAFSVHAAEQSTGSLTKPNLYFLVVDMSGSIKPLTGNIKTGVKVTFDEISKKNQDTVVKMLLFSSRDNLLPINGKIPFDETANKELFSDFVSAYKPTNGPTALFYTADHVFRKVWEERDNFDRIDIIFLTDGADEEKRENGRIVPAFMGERDGKYCRTFDDVINNLPDEIKDWLLKGRSNDQLVWVFLGKPEALDKVKQGELLPPKLVDPTSPLSKVLMPKPHAAFSVNPTKLEVNQEIMAALKSLVGVETVTWDFGDGTPKTIGKPEPVKHQYDKAGEYTITVTVAGQSGEETAKVKVEVKPEVPLEANFSIFPEKIRINELVQFTDMSLGDPEEYEWEIREQNWKSTEKNPKVSFASPGKITVALTVRRTGKEPHRTEKTIRILPELPKAEFSVEPQVVDYGKTVEIKAKFHENGWTHSWVVGKQEFTGETITWKADAQGAVDIQHKVKNEVGDVTTKSDRLFVKDPEAPDADFSYTEKLIAGTEITFTPKTKTEGAEHSWLIEGMEDGFKNGFKRSGKGDSFSEKLEAGDYTVTHDVVYPSGKTNSVNKEIHVNERLQVSFSISTPAEERQCGSSIVFSDTSKGSIKERKWNFGDGSEGAGQNVPHKYDKKGEYTVTLTVVDPDGKQHQTSETITIMSTIEAKFSVKGRVEGELPLGKHPFVVQTKNETSPDKGVSYKWNFGDGTPESTEFEPRHEYTKTGNYEITLVVTDNASGSMQSAPAVMIRITPNKLLRRCLIATAVIFCILVVLWGVWLINGAGAPPVKKRYVLGKGKFAGKITVGPSRKRLKGHYELNLPITPKSTLIGKSAELQRSPKTAELDPNPIIDGQWEITSDLASLSDNPSCLGKDSAPLKTKIKVFEKQVFEYNGYPYMLFGNKVIPGWQISDKSRGKLKIRRTDGHEYFYDFDIQDSDRMSLMNGDRIDFGGCAYRFEWNNPSENAELVRASVAPWSWIPVQCAASVVLLCAPMLYYTYKLFV